MVIITQAKEGSQSTNNQLKNVWNGLNPDFLNPQSAYINHVTQIFHLNLEKSTFFKMQLKVLFPKLIKYLILLHIGYCINDDVKMKMWKWMILIVASI